MGHHKIPVFIITGFLGSGKTTFINHFIKTNETLRVLVIENEIGKTNIDGALLIQDQTDIRELTAGCLCCDLNEKLYDLLFELSQKKDAFDILIIETTGIADPAAVAETFWTGEYMEKHFEIRSVICLADAQNMLTSISQNEEARRQLTFADVVLLNKCDQAHREDIDHIQSVIAQIHPEVHVFEGSEGVFPIEQLISLNVHLTSKKEKMISGQELTGIKKHHGIHTFTLTYEGAFDYRKLKHILMLLINVNKSQIYRIKGLLNIDGMYEKIVLQSVYKSYRMEEGSPWSDHEKRESKIVFIGHEVEKESMDRVFKQCLVKATTES
jgi:G3E family GTPase